MIKGKKIPGVYARYVQTLVEYDGPQVVLVESKKGGLYVCVPIDDTVEGYNFPFLAVGVSKKDFKSYVDEAFDLNYLMEYKSAVNTYVFDISKYSDGKFHLKYVDFVHAGRKKYLPDSGFFARNHTQEYAEPEQKDVVTRTYYIDGRWTTNDFSRFYARLSDLYAIYTIADIADDNIVAEQKLEAAITSYSFQGGGSYRSSFKDIGDASNDNYPLKVARIQYASPGRIDVRGVEAPLNIVDLIINGFADESGDIKESAKILYKLLQAEGALGKKHFTFSNTATEKYALEISNKIFEVLRLPNREKINEICSDRPVVFAKLALALYRRALSIARFHEEGRVSLVPR